MKILIFCGFLMTLAWGAIAHQATENQAEALDAERTAALANTAFPGPMRTYENCLGQSLLDGQTLAQSQSGCQRLANHEVSLTLGSAQILKFNQEVKRLRHP